MKIYTDPNFRPPAHQVNKPEIMTIKEVAEYLRIGEKSAYKLAKEGELPAFKVVNKWRFDRELIHAMVMQKSIN
jgi:excisionase family DNA binding protein